MSRKPLQLVRELYEDKTVGLARYQNLQELLNAIKQFVDSEEDKSLGTFLQSVSLLTNADTNEPTTATKSPS
jgi:DNA helicase-2/ATP-dependent DNA helicase PcrA